MNLIVENNPGKSVFVDVDDRINAKKRQSQGFIVPLLWK